MTHDPYYGYTKDEWTRMSRKERRKARIVSHLKMLLFVVIVIAVVFGFTALSMCVQGEGAFKKKSRKMDTAMIVIPAQQITANEPTEDVLIHCRLEYLSVSLSAESESGGIFAKKSLLTTTENEFCRKLTLLFGEFHEHL